MSKHDDFDILGPSSPPPPRRQIPMWVWVAIVLGVALLAFAAGMAFSTLSTRLSTDHRPTGTPIAAAQSSPTKPLTATVVALGTPLLTPTGSVMTTPTAKATVPVTPTIPAACTQPVNSQLVAIYHQNELGCASDSGAVVWAAWEPFERGYMLWRSDTDRAYAFFNDGTWRTIDERWDNKELPSRGDPPSGLQAPIRGFGYAWGLRDDLFNNLGWAKSEEKGFCALIQSFQGGFILQSDTVEFCKEQLYNQARAPEWTPLVIAVTYDGLWRQP